MHQAGKLHCRSHGLFTGVRFVFRTQVVVMVGAMESHFYQRFYSMAYHLGECSCWGALTEVADAVIPSSFVVALSDFLLLYTITQLSFSLSLSHPHLLSLSPQYAASRTMRYIVTSFAIGGIFCALILVATVQLFRQTRVFFSASTAFLSLTLLGVIFMCAGVILMALPQTSFTCMAKYFLGNIGMSLAFGSQLLKMYRLQAIFNRRLMVVVQMRDSMLIPWLVGYVLLECMLLMIGCLAAPLKTDPVDGRCVISSRFDALYFTVVGMKVLLFFFSIYLVYATRNIPSGMTMMMPSFCVFAASL